MLIEKIKSDYFLNCKVNYNAAAVNYVAATTLLKVRHLFSINRHQHSSRVKSKFGAGTGKAASKAGGDILTMIGISMATFIGMKTLVADHVVDGEILANYTNEAANSQIMLTEAIAILRDINSKYTNILSNIDIGNVSLEHLGKFNNSLHKYDLSNFLTEAKVFVNVF